MWRILGIFIIIVGLFILAWPRREKLIGWFRKHKVRPTKTWRVAGLFVMIASLSFLLWPRPLHHYIYKPPCASFYDDCGQYEVESWKLGGGFDVLCSFVIGDPLVKNDGFIISQFNPCLGQHQRYDPNKGHYYTDGDFNLLVPALGSILLGAGGLSVYLLQNYYSKKLSSKLKRG